MVHPQRTQSIQACPIQRSRRYETEEIGEKHVDQKLKWLMPPGKATKSSEAPPHASCTGHILALKGIRCLRSRVICTGSKHSILSQLSAGTQKRSHRPIHKTYSSCSSKHLVSPSHRLNHEANYDSSAK